MPQNATSFQATPEEEIKFRADKAVSDALKYNPGLTQAEQAQVRSAAEAQWKSYLAPTQKGEVKRRWGTIVNYTLDNAGNKQFYLDKGSTGVYNPLYDVGSPEYQSNLLKVSNPNISAPKTTPNVTLPQSTQVPTVNTANLTQAYQGQNQVAPTQANASSSAVQPKITIPSSFQQNFGPSSLPSTIPGGITMPNLTGTKKNTAGSNWSDLFSVAQNRYQR